MPQKSGNGERDLLGLFIVEMVESVARSISLTVEVFLHKRFGPRYIGCGFFGVLIILFFTMWFPPQTIVPLEWFAIAYGVWWLVAAINAAIRFFRKQDKMHTRYNGYPYLWRLLPRWQETSAKYLEALLAILLGYGVHHLNKPLGDYLMLAASFVLLRAYGSDSEQRTKALDLNDSVIEQRMIAERFRAMQE